MQYDFLKQFSKRMKTVGLHAALIANSSQKTIWKTCGFESFDEQLNMIYAVLLFIMEQSLKEADCTMDDITAYIDQINGLYFQKPLSTEDCYALGDFIINVVLANEGRQMGFKGYDFETGVITEIPVSYLANRVIYTRQDVRRTSYYLTDDGYNLLLGTLEVENNMKLTIQEMIFQMHLEKQSYDKALDDVKAIFNLLRIQLQKIREAMIRIRRNALEYNVGDYRQILQENLDTITQTKEKFEGYRMTVQSRIKELREREISLENLTESDASQLEILREIDQYLCSAIDEYQKILNSHFDLKTLYTAELEKITEMALVQRFDINSDFFSRLLHEEEGLKHLHLFLGPLFNRNPEKSYNLTQAFLPQILRRQSEETADAETLDFDAEDWEAERSRQIQEKMSRYECCLETILALSVPYGKRTLSEIGKEAAKDTVLLSHLIPDLPTFKEVMVELLKNAFIDMDALRKESSDTVFDLSNGLKLGEMLPRLMSADPARLRISDMHIKRLPRNAPVVFENVQDISGSCKFVRCSDVIFEFTEKAEG